MFLCHLPSLWICHQCRPLWVRRLFLYPKHGQFSRPVKQGYAINDFYVIVFLYCFLTILHKSKIPAALVVLREKICVHSNKRAHKVVSAFCPSARLEEAFHDEMTYVTFLCGLLEAKEQKRKQQSEETRWNCPGCRIERHWRSLISPFNPLLTQGWWRNSQRLHLWQETRMSSCSGLPA